MSGSLSTYSRAAVLLLTVVTTASFLAVPIHARAASTTTIQLEVQVITPTPTPTPTPTLTTTPTPESGGGGGGGGGGGAITTPATTSAAVVELRGYAYPGAVVNVLKDGVGAGSTLADDSGSFSFTLSGLSGGTYNFGFWAQDKSGRRSLTFTFQLGIRDGSTTKVSGVIVPPTISTNTSSVAPGEKIVVSGAAAPGGQIRIQVASDPREYLAQALASGDYSREISTVGFEKGMHTAKSKTELTVTGEESIYSQLVTFGVGVIMPKSLCQAKSDINSDKRVNLIDFSIMAYWWKRKLPSGSPVDLNCDGALTLADFSILAFNWSG